MDNKIIKVIIVDEDKTFRQGMKISLDLMKNISVCAEIEDKRKLLILLKKNPDVIVFIGINILLKEISDTIWNLFQQNKAAKIIVFSQYCENLTKFLGLGFKGFALKDIIYSELEYAIKKVDNGEIYYCDKIALFLEENYVRLNAIESCQLTKKDIDFLNYLKESVTNQQISNKLFLEERAIERQKLKLYKKTNTHCLKDLIVFALKNKIIKF
jgi:DNA-binding NarL/FixJ family response regulator